MLDPKKRKKIIEGLKDVEEGRISHRGLAKKYNVSKTIVCLIHVQDLEERIKAKTQELSAKSGELSAKSDELAKVTSECLRKSQELAVLKKDYDYYAPRKDEIGKIKEQLDPLQKEIEEKQKWLDRLKAEINRCQREREKYFEDSKKAADLKEVIQQQNLEIKQNQGILNAYIVFWALQYIRSEGRKPPYDLNEFLESIKKDLMSTLVKDVPTKEEILKKVQELKQKEQPREVDKAKAESNKSGENKEEKWEEDKRKIDEALEKARAEGRIP